MRNENNSLIQEIEIEDVFPISPHNRALYEAGKTMLTDSIETSRDFCKFMISLSTGAIPVYFTILNFIVSKDYTFNFKQILYVTTPSIIFLFSSIFFSIGYYPKSANFSLDIPDEIENERCSILARRSKFSKIGFSLFLLAALISIFIVTYAYLIAR